MDDSEEEEEEEEDSESDSDEDSEQDDSSEVRAIFLQSILGFKFMCGV